MTSDIPLPEPVFEFDNEADVRPGGAQEPWRVLLVDDDLDVHQATVFAVGQHHFVGRPVSFLHAYSATQAKSILLSEKGLAFILLDVVMESHTAGLDLVDFIRQTAGLDHTRIVLRTGQPGYAPGSHTTLKRALINPALAGFRVHRKEVIGNFLANRLRVTACWF